MNTQSDYEKEILKQLIDRFGFIMDGEEEAIDCDAQLKVFSFMDWLRKSTPFNELQKAKQEIKKLKKMCLDEMEKNTKVGTDKQVKEIGGLNQNLHNQLTEIAKENTHMREMIQEAYTEIWQTQIYPYESRGTPKGDDILKKHFPWLKPDKNTPDGMGTGIDNIISGPKN